MPFTIGFSSRLSGPGRSLLTLLDALHYALWTGRFSENEGRL